MPLESIAFRIPADGRWIRNSITKPEWATKFVYIFTSELLILPSIYLLMAHVLFSFYRLTRFETQYIFRDFNNYRQDVLFQLFTAQKNLTIIKLRIMERNKMYAKKLILCILESCANLREFHLKIDFGASVNITANEFPLFFSSIFKLSYLCIMDIRFTFSDELLPPLPSTNMTLKKLKFERTANVEFLSVVFKSCPKLQLLKVFVRTNDVLQGIFEHLVGVGW